MSIQFGDPHPPRIYNPELVFAGILVGLVLVLISVYITDQLGTWMFKRGFAKPFYIRGRRIHHSCIYYILPVSYGIMTALFLLGYIQPIYSSLWIHLAYVGIVCGVAMAVDFVGDKYWPRIRKNVILHHEWLYTIVPFYIFTYVVNVVI